MRSNRSTSSAFTVSASIQIQRLEPDWAHPRLHSRTDSATLHRWYENWIQNKDNVTAKYGERWYRIWLYFLASATIASRQGSASIFQITCHKNLSGYHRIEVRQER